MENWITRGMAALCAIGGAALFWAFGLFTGVPLREGRLLAMTGVELQVAAVALFAGIAVMWGAMHLFGLADRETHPAFYRALRFVLLLLVVAAITYGGLWGEARFVSLS